MADYHRRRRRVRHPEDPAAPERDAARPAAAGRAERERPRSQRAAPRASGPVPEPPSHPVPQPPAERVTPPRHRDEGELSERGLRGLVGAGTSQLSPGTAMRARDAARPTDEDLVAVERDLEIIRRHWVPRD